MNYTILFILILSACSFQKSKDNRNSPTKNLVSAQNTLDSDGDGKSDLDEIEASEDPFIAEIPQFTGEMLQEVKIKTSFYNRTLDKFTQSELLINTEDENTIIKKGQNLIRNLVEDLSGNAQRNQNNFSLEISADQIDYYSAPIISDGVAHNFMANNSNLEANGFNIDSVEFELRNKINFESKRFSSFRDLILDVYFYDYQEKRLEFIDSFKNKGSFEFNKEHLLDITSIKTRNVRILDNSVLRAGRFLYIKIKDFYIPEIQKNYSDLLKDVRKKSTPFILNSPDGLKISYVGTNGLPTPIKDMFSKALKDSYEIDNNQFIKYKDFPVGEYRHDTTDGNRINVYSTWHLITNEISNNPYSYSFLPTDIAVLNYSKSTDPLILAKNVFSKFSHTKESIIMKGEGLHPVSTRKIKIIVSNLTAFEPKISESFFSKRSCSDNLKCVDGNVIYKKKDVYFSQEPIMTNDSRFQQFLNNTVLEIDGFEYPLIKLLGESKFSMKVDEEGKVVLETEESFIKSLKGFGSTPLKFSLFHRRSQKILELGSSISSCEDCWAACGGPGRRAGCNFVKDVGQTDRRPINLDYSFYSSVFVY